MHALVRAPDRRTFAVVGPGLLLALVLGLAAGRWPMIAAGAALAIALAAVMFRDLAAGIVLFTLASFAAVLSLGGAATGAKGIGVLLVLAWVATIARRRGKDVRSLIRDHRWLVAFAAAIVAWSVVSAAWAQSPRTALVGASRYAQDLVLLPVIYTGVTRFKHVRSLAAAFVAGAVGAMAYGALTGSTVDSSRLVGALGDPNETAAVLVVAAILAAALGASRSVSSRHRALARVGAVAALVGVAATASRGGAIALAVAGIAAVLIAGRWRRQVTTAAAIGTVLFVAWFAFLAPASSRSHITSTQSGRTTLWAVAGRAIAASPIVGLGNDNFAVAAKDFLVRPGATDNAGQVVLVPHVAHNVYLELWADLGIVGLALFVGFVVLSLRAAWRAAGVLQRAGRHGDELLARALVVAIVGILAAAFFVSDLYSKQLFLLLALGPAMLRAAQDGAWSET
jgi:putative inorganic carbon (hco3(-)) transporter